MPALVLAASRLRAAAARTSTPAMKEVIVFMSSVCGHDARQATRCHHPITDTLRLVRWPAACVALPLSVMLPVEAAMA